jgi:putative membrane-bound dehydrogenase-like protein
MKKLLILPTILTAGLLSAAEPRAPKDTQTETIRLTTPQQAAESFAAPEGFSVSLFAGEPDVRQPIAITTDARGRLWIAENNTYAERPASFDPSQRDNITILEDTDHDGRADKRTVFWDQAQKLTSIEIGLGGVWALCPPKLLFIPDRDDDDVPDGEPQVVLDGWNAEEVQHNIVNGLKWGPDGWLYGRHGILADSLVGAPGAAPPERTRFNCGVWRYHPTTKAFEVVCRGTTNPWGMDWNEHGEMFFINTVIGHLWHGVPGAHFQRMYGEDDNPRLYELIPQTADHFHWDTAEAWSDIRQLGVSPTTDQAGGGHAHSGLLIYQGDNWPARYRGTVLTINLHGRRLNNDILERSGAGYVGRHAPDLFRTSDPWFRAVELIAGADGGVFLADWSDIGECHEADGVHRSSGRIFKLTYGKPEPPTIADLARSSDVDLAKAQITQNEWLARQARQVLQRRAAAGRNMDAVNRELKAMFTGAASTVARLRALWCLHATGGDADDWLLKHLGHPDEQVRVWVVRLLGDHRAPSPDALSAFAGLAETDSSGLVLLYLASTLEKLPNAARWAIAEPLARRAEFAADPVLPLMIWYGIEPAVPDDPQRATRLAAGSRMSVVVRSIGAGKSIGCLSLRGAPPDRAISLAGGEQSERSSTCRPGRLELRGPAGHGRCPPGAAQGAHARGLAKRGEIAGR